MLAALRLHAWHHRRGAACCAPTNCTSLTVAPTVPTTGAEALMALARDTSPRVEAVADDLVVVDAGGLVRLFGTPRAFAARVAHDARARGLEVSVVVAPTRTVAVMCAMAATAPFERVVREGQEAAALAMLAVDVLARLDGVAVDPDAEARAPRAPAGHYRLAPAPAAGLTGATPVNTHLAPAAALVTLGRWGIHTLGQLAALPANGVHARLGALGTRWHRLARGLDERPLVQVREALVFEESMALEWPIEGLEPLSFVLARLLDPLCQRLERHDQGATALRTALRLVTRDVHVRVVPLPAPLRDPKVLRTLVLLDLEAHPPPAGIDEVWLAVDTAPGRIVQGSLLSKPLPAPEQVSTLLARLTALMGEGRCGSPVPVDTHRPGACALAPFRIVEATTQSGHESRPGRPWPSAQCPVPSAGNVSNTVRTLAVAPPSRHAERAAFRRFRHPVAVRVSSAAGRPAHLAGLAGSDGRGRVRILAGPWRTAGAWWACAEPSWDRDEWDVELDDLIVYRIYQDRAGGQWYVEGYWD